MFVTDRAPEHHKAVTAAARFSIKAERSKVSREKYCSNPDCFLAFCFFKPLRKLLPVHSIIQNFIITYSIIAFNTEQGRISSIV